MTEGFLNHKQRHPIALVAALSINVAAVTALMLAKMGVPLAPPGVIELINPTIVEPPAPPPDVPREKEVDIPRKTTIYVPPRQVEREVQDPGDRLEGTGEPWTGNASEGTGDGVKVEPEPTPTPLPVIVGAMPLPSAARDFQPPYPSQLLRMEVEGKTVVRVLIGADGRVKQVAIISADDPLFAEATERQALRKWRFKPATRDGVAVESWKQMTVRFEIRS